MTDDRYAELIEFLHFVPIAVLKCYLHGKISMANPRCSSTFLSELQLPGFPNLMEFFAASDSELVSLIQGAEPPGQICTGHRIWVDAPAGRFAFALDIHLTGDRELLVSLKDETVVAQKEEQLRHMSRHDNLTNLANRKYFRELAELEIERALRYGQPLSVLAADLDFFKKINDTYGHFAGDAVLINISRLIEQMTREVDTAARFGGEEFCVLLPGTSQTDGRVVAEKIRYAVEQNPIDHQGKMIKTSISIGVAQYVTGETFEQLMSRADKALYLAKDTGRNRIELA